ncbi:MAG: hypothetical protein K0Q95_584 [Bacteroidota bacterium]|jgi:hypothetical protein|nr:hypothetical protein [Bacteroidota bacterium]
MNKYVYESYSKLRETEKAEFIGRFKNSPTVIKFIQFLDKNKAPDFKTRSAIEIIYATEKERVAYPTLENRFFKLRKKLIDELAGSGNTDNVPVYPEEELQFSKAKQLISENKEAAFRQLQELERICWERNIFELLPAIIDHLIFCNQSFNRLSANKPLYERMEKAIGLLRDINICVMTTRKIYEINFTKGVKHAVNELGLMRKYAAKHKEFSRFLMCYHHVSAYYKLGSADSSQESQVISRHLNAYKKLQAKHPMVPLMSYKVNYVQQQHLHFNQMTMSYHFSKCEFEETYQVMKEVWSMINGERPDVKMYKTESSFYNMITAQCMTQRYREALNTIDDFIAYLKSNHQLDKLIIPNVLKARIYVDVYPHAYRMDLQYLFTQVEIYLKILKKQDNMMISYDQTLILKMKMLILQGDFLKATGVLNDPISKSYLENLGMYQAFCELIRILKENSTHKQKELVVLNKQIQALKHKVDSPAQYMHIFWLLHYLKLVQV